MTDLSAAYLHWRYGFEPLRYRAVPVGDRIEDGLVVVRMRRRGEALECAVVEVVVPRGASTRGFSATSRGAREPTTCCSAPVPLVCSMGSSPHRSWARS
ncbi:MAG: hypothetical protein M5U19_20350 [Microthrixaceae bacterium]|nr:hypothetical protein [Microthrixaceae bacterium]